MTVKIAYLFPGQGSQTVGMGEDLYDRSPAAREVFAEADAALGFALSEICFTGPKERLMLTEITQPAILTASLAVFRTLGIVPDLAAGHSLGEYSALVAADALDFSDAVRTVHLRGKFMQEAVPAGQGAMYAVVGNDFAELEALIADLGEGLVQVANYNSPKQVAISGARPQTERIAGALKSLKAMKLPVSAPFHCRLMAPAAAKLAEELAKIPFRTPKFPVLRNLDAATIENGEQARRGLIEQVVNPVQWTTTIERMAAAGVTRGVEVGPGKVLLGLLAKTAPEIERVSLQSLADIEAYRQ